LGEGIDMAQIIGIFVAPEKGASMQSVERVMAKAGVGLVGDRYFSKVGTFKKKIHDVTLLEEEAILAVKRDYEIDFAPIESRRNLLTRGIALNHLVGAFFRVGNVRMRGVELSEPCGYLERLTGKKIREALVHRGGIRAEILEDGELALFDEINLM